MKLIFTLTVLLLASSSYAFSPDLYRNNKESISRKITNHDIERMNEWLKSHELSEEIIYRDSVHLLNRILSHFVEQKNHCDLYLSPRISKALLQKGIIKDENEIYPYLVFLRHTNLTDDIFYDLLKKSSLITNKFELYKNQPAGRRPVNLYRRYSRINDLKKLYEPFQEWPNEVDSCTVQTYLKHVNQLGLSTASARSKDLRKLNWLALNQQIISLETYNKLEVLREANLTQWLVTTSRYIDIIKNAKDKKAVTVEDEATDDYPSTYVLRKENITRRGKLYGAYNSTQVFLMSQIIERTAKRMDAKYVELSFQYTDDPEGETEIYVFSPMEQYRISINMLKKEIAELLRSESFRGAPFDYGDLIAASYETGLLRSEDIDQVLKFEDFWNPNIPKWKTYLNYAFSLAGTATYYLPPPWNILGALGLIMTEMKFSDEPKADPSDNWNTII